MFIQNQKVPAQITGNYEIDNFEYGLNNIKSAFELRHGESPDLLNVIALEQGSVETRPGLFKYITQNIGKNVKRAFVYETATISMFILSTESELYKINTDGSDLAKLCDVADTIRGVQFETSFFFVDGDKYRVYDGTNVYEIINPTTVTGMAQGGTGTSITLPEEASDVDDEYVGYTVYIASGTGSGESRIITDYAGGTKIATVNTNWATAPDATSVIYMTSVPQGVLTTNEDNFTKCFAPSYFDFNNTFKGLNNIEMISDCKKLLLHKTRMWFGISAEHPNIVYSTDIDNMYYVPMNAYYPPITNDKDFVNGLISFDDALVIFKQTTIFALYGFDETDYVLKEIAVPTGAINDDVICKAGDYIFYLGTDGIAYGIYDVTNAIEKLKATPLCDTIDLIKAPISVYPDDWKDSFAHYYNGFYFLKVHDKMLVYKVNSGWFLWDNIEPTVMLTYENTILLTNSDMYIYRLPLHRFYVEETFIAEEGQTDFTVELGWLNSVRDDAVVIINDSPVSVDDAEIVSRDVIRVPNCQTGDTVTVSYLSLLKYIDGEKPYDSHWNTHDMDMSYHSQIKQIRNVHASIIAVDYNVVDLRFDAYIDYANVDGSYHVTNGISLWGVSRFGTKFSTRNTIAPIMFPVNRRGKIIRYKYSTSGANQPFKIFNINGIVTVRDIR